MSRRKTFALIIFLFASHSSFAQNSPPVLANITALADTILHKLTVTYDVSDAENDSLEIFLNASTNGGDYFPYNTSNATGDVGFPVTPGTGKRIVWYYPDSLSLMLSSFVAKLAADDHASGITIPQIIEQIDSNRLKQNVQLLEGIRHRTTGAAHLQAVRDSLLARFQQYGLETRIHQFPYNNYTGENIIGRKVSANNDTRVFIVDGHYDTVDDSPGADDNGSGLAAILEILRVLAPLELTSSIEFIGFDLEEQGLLGSEAFVPGGIQPDEKIAGVFNLDMIGFFSDQPNSQTMPPGFDIFFPDLYAELVANEFRANFIISTANTNSNSLLFLLDSMATQYVPDLLIGNISVPGTGTLIADSRRSDHAAFWDAGYKALHLSDGAETRNANYHGPNDTTGTLNFTFIHQITQAVAASLLHLSPPAHADIEVVQVAGDPASSICKIADGGCKIFLSPNPSDGHFKITAESCGDEAMNVKLISIEGKLIWKGQLPAGGELEFTEKITPGYYLVEIGNSQKTYAQKILAR